MLPIAFYENSYVLQTNGSVISLQNNLPLTPIKNPNGYVKVGLANGDGTKKQMSVHRLIAEHYLPNPYKHKQVNHKDGNKLNNDVTNLEWCTAKYNTQHALESNLRPGFMGADDRDLLIAKIYAGATIRELANKVGRGEKSLSGMLRRRTYERGDNSYWKQHMKERRSERTALRNKGLL